MLHGGEPYCEGEVNIMGWKPMSEDKQVDIYGNIERNDYHTIVKKEHIYIIYARLSTYIIYILSIDFILIYHKVNRRAACYRYHPLAYGWWN